MNDKPWLISESNWKTIKEIRYELAVLPWGATEPHNYHLPYGTDNIEAGYAAAEAGRLAWEKGAKIAILPTIPYGVQTSMLDLPFCINMNPSTQEAVLGDIARSLDGQGIEKLVIINGHGGNHFRQMIRELQPEVDIFLCAVDWYRAANWDDFFIEPGDHAGEFETSVIMHLRPDLARPLSEAGDGKERRFRIKAMREGWAWAPRVWSEITKDTGVGNPAYATAEKGARFLEAATKNLAQFLTDLAKTGINDLYDNDDK